MNSSILVTGFVVVGVGAMAVFFAPFGSNDTSTPELAGAYQTGKVQSVKVAAPSKANVNSEVDNEPFVWENTKKPVSGSDILDDLDTDKAAVKENNKPRGLAAKPQKKPVSSNSGIGLDDLNDSTADVDLDSFFGPSQTTKKPLAQPSKKTTERQSAAPFADNVKKTAPTKQFPVAPREMAPQKLVSEKVTAKAAPPKVSESKASPLVKSAPVNETDMFTFSPKSNDAPNFAPGGSPELDAPEIEPAEKSSVATKPKTDSSEISGSLQPVVTAPVDKAQVISKVKITNPQATGLTVTFLVNGQKVALKPRQSYVIRKADEVQVKFSRGGSFGFAEQSLTEGDYRFSVSRESGWNLMQ